MDFASIISFWYSKNKRDLPWRNSSDPYKIWLSEVILQQTRVQQGLPYYTSFVKNYPNVKKLASAPEAEVLKLWQGLGYYSRARNLHAAAKMVAGEYKGKFPQTYTELLKLKGVGEYTAAAIASFAYNEAQAVVDGNVYRVLSRIFGIETAIDSPAGKKEFRELAQELIDKRNPGTFNQAIMEFGALYCVPKNPDCENCPFVLHCEARKKKAVDRLPYKAGKTKVTDRYFYYLVLQHKGHVYMKQRTEKGIWQGLHDFPLIETQQKFSQKELMKSAEWEKLFAGQEFELQGFSEEHRHILSHQRLYVRFITLELKKKMPVSVSKDWMYVKEADLKKHAVPVLIEKFLK